MTLKDKLTQSGIAPEAADLADLWAILHGEAARFELKKSEIGSEMASLLAFHEITRAKIANKLGWPESRLSKVLSGKENLTIKTIFEFCDAFGVEFDVIFRKLGGQRAPQLWENQALLRDIRRLHEDLGNSVQQAQAMLESAKAVNRLAFRKALTSQARFKPIDQQAANEPMNGSLSATA
jgi:transcriptional regulator with XRE-family HTH domain